MGASLLMEVLNMDNQQFFELILYLRMILTMLGAIVGGGCAYFVFQFLKHRSLF